MRETNSINLSYLLLITLMLSQFVTLAFSQSMVVKSLPGFHGDLPFKLYTGYIGVGEDEEVQLFYYFFESERDPKTDPFMLWLTGGPGCMSLSSVFFEHIGPLSFNYTALDITKSFNRTTSSWEIDMPPLQLNRDTWTKEVNILFLESPVGTGFSYAKTPELYHTVDVIASKQINEFLEKWFVENPQFASNPLYIGGSSFCGLIVPLVTQEIVNGIEDGTGPQFNLKGYLLGSPATTELYGIDYYTKIDFAHRVSLLSDEVYEATKVICGGHYWNNVDNAKCQKNVEYSMKLFDPNSFDNIMEPDCNNVSLNHFCLRDYMAIIETWANTVEVREALHVRKGTVGDVIRCNRTVQARYNTTLSGTIGYHQNLSTKPLKALIWSGDQEVTVPYLGTIRWIEEKLNVTIDDKWRPWNSNGGVAGYTIYYTNGLFNLTYATVKAAGHSASNNKPRECVDMFNRWLASNPL